MNKKQFLELLRRYVDGKATDDEARLIETWYALLGSSNPSEITREDLNQKEEELWQKIEARTINKEVPRNIVIQKHHYLPSGWLSAAAVVAAIVVSSVLLIKSMNNSAPAENVIAADVVIHKTNQTDEPSTILLEDGSEVILQPGSTIDYPQHFAANKREAILEGEGFFTIKRSEERPFYVYNKNLVTRVLGTSFNVKADRKNGKVEVAVRTGKVMVYENPQHLKKDAIKEENNGVILTPNQKATFFVKQHHFVTALVEKPLPLVVNGKNDSARFIFEETPLSIVLQQLELSYNIEIMPDNEGLNSFPFTGDISGQSLFDKLELICQAIGACYEVKGTAILIKQRGCD